MNRDQIAERIAKGLPVHPAEAQGLLDEIDALHKESERLLAEAGVERDRLRREVRRIQCELESTWSVLQRVADEVRKAAGLDNDG